MKLKDRTPSFLKSFSACRSAFACCLFLAPCLSHGDAVFDFPNAHPLLGEGVDDGTDGRMTVTDLAVAIPVTISTVEIVGQDGTLASEGVLNVMGSGNDAMGVNSLTNSNGNSKNSRDFDPGEQWVFKFDVDVELVEIDFAGWTDGESEVTLSFSDATPDIVLNAIVASEEYDLSNTPIAAGVEITLEVTNLVGDNQVRLQEITVAAVAGPPTGDNLVWNGVDGAAWNTADANFTGDDTIFTTGDNVEIQTAGAINVDALGISAGLLTDTTSSGTVSLQNGDLTATTFTKSGASTLLVDSSVTLEATISTILSGGTLQIASGATLTTNSVNFSGGSIFQVDSGASFTAGAAGILGAGGVIFDTDETISFGDLLNNSLEVDPKIPLIKQGSGALTLTGELGVQNSGAVALDILDGSITAQGDNQLNIGGTNVWNGDISLVDADLEFHGSSVSGTGSIIAQSGSASINGRFNRGTTSIANGILLNSDLLVDAPANSDNGSELHLNGVISGVGNLEKGGNGRVVLSGANGYTSSTTVTAGVLQVGGGLSSTAGTLGTGAVSLVAGAIEFSRNDAVVVSNVISGVGSVIVNNGASGSTELSAANDYTGVTAIEGGTLIAFDIDDGGFSSSIGAATADAVNLVLRGQGILSYTGEGALTDRAFSLGGLANDSLVGGGTISADGTGPIEFDSTVDVGADGNGTAERVLTLSGVAPGVSSIALRITDGQASTHSVVKDGTTTWLLTGVNTYTGDTVINNGILQLGALTDLTNTSVVRINGATSILQLTDGVSDVIKELWIDGVQMGAGLYGSSTSSAPVENQDDTHFIGTGTLAVTSGAGYEAWAAASGIDGELGADDFDLDGMSNLMEYALGTDPTASTQSAGAYAGNTLIFTKGSDAITNGDVSWMIETSELLTSESWTPQVIQAAGDVTATIEYTFTPGSPEKEFARLNVVIAE